VKKEEINVAGKQAMTRKRGINTAFSFIASGGVVWVANKIHRAQWCYVPAKTRGLKIY